MSESIVTRFVRPLSRDYLLRSLTNAIICDMSDAKLPRFKPPVENYPWRIVLFRWFLLALEAGIAFYFVFTFSVNLGLIYVAYGVVYLFLLLPLIRCVRCYYYGKRCNFGWGTWVAQVFPRDDTNPHGAYYGYTILFWPLRIFPTLRGLGGLLMSLPDQMSFIPQGLFAVYLLVIFIHRRFYMRQSCVRCHQRVGCPVYNSGIVGWNAEKQKIA